jgi:DNA polymerase III subunit alpha
MPIEEYFRALSLEGLERRLAQLYPDAERDAKRPEYLRRLEFEIATIVKMGFPGYFLIVGDFINWAKSHGCPVGPGRGSGAGSLVAYALGITDLDPLRYKLLFERFLNPERVSMPDFDIDFCQGNRDRVIDYVKDKYGRDAVSQIATFGTMAAKAALRDVGRVLGMGYGHVDSDRQADPGAAGQDGDAGQGAGEARRRRHLRPQGSARTRAARSRRGRGGRAAGAGHTGRRHGAQRRHARRRRADRAGQDHRLLPALPAAGQRQRVSQYDKDDVEAIGLVKFDFLGLATLTILELAKDFIRARRKGREDFSYETLPLDDAQGLPPVQRGPHRGGVPVRIRRHAAHAARRQAQPAGRPDRLERDVPPGPMENIPSFCARKHGAKTIEYPHAAAGAGAVETYGIFVYQEQVMQAAQLMGGYSLGGADLLRRAMGKKKPEEMAEHRGLFREGAAKQGISAEKADEVFDLMEKFAGYGFNKSHAAAYSLLAYHTAWIKVHCRPSSMPPT